MAAPGATGPVGRPGTGSTPPYGPTGSIGSVTVGSLPAPGARGPADNVAAALPTVPATVESTWRIFATALGQSAPANAYRARNAIRRIAGSGK